jgi:hypothetical protein
MHHQDVPVVFGCNFYGRLAGKPAEVDASFNFASDNLAVYFIAQIMVRMKHLQNLLLKIITRSEMFRKPRKNLALARMALSL